MALQPSQPYHSRWSLAELTVSEALVDLLDVEPLDLGPGSPASTALAEDRDTESHTGRDGR